MGATRKAQGEQKKMGKGKGKSVLTNDKQANTTSKRGKYK